MTRNLLLESGKVHEELGAVDDFFQVEIVLGSEQRRRIQISFFGECHAEHRIPKFTIVRSLIEIQSSPKKI